MKKIITALLLVCMVVLGTGSRLDAADADVDTWIPEEYQNYCVQAGEQYAIVPELLMAMMERESWGEPWVSNGACKGLMQINEPYHKNRMIRLGVADIYDPYGNILVAADYLSDLFTEYGDMGTVLMVYNGSSHAIERGESGAYTEYASSIIARTSQLERLHGK